MTLADTNSTAATSAGGGEYSSSSARLLAAHDAWKRKLIDLAKRNRALNFRPTKLSTVAIVDEKAAEVFRQLAINEQAMKFAPALQSGDGGDGQGKIPPPSAASIDADERGWLDSDEYGAVGVDFVPYDRSALSDRYTDDVLQTASAPEALDRSLRRLDDQSRLTMEEQGVNTLFLTLGMLDYTEAESSSERFRAPVVLLPVTLERKSARSAYTVRAAEDDPIVNPALAEYLRANFGLQLPELPESNAIPDDFDLQALLRTISDATSSRPGWSVKTDIFLGLFSFQKFVMYKDLEKNASALLEHPLIRRLITNIGTLSAGEVLGLPDEIRELDLDGAYPPEQTAQVVDADSSQLRAIAGVSRGYDLVIEGPPGTGKSQTITNLIAQALSAGKSVLFVAEKMAALDVVHTRLVRAGLGEFCLAMHSTKANKRDVMRSIGSALDASMERVTAPAQSTQRLPHVRTTLSEYIDAVHTPHGSLGIKPYDAYGELALVIDAPRARYSGPVDGDVTTDRIDETIRILRDIAATSAVVGVPAQHPWRDTSRTFYSEDDLLNVESLSQELAACLADVEQRGTSVKEALGLPEVRTLRDADTAADIAEVLSRSPGAPLAVLGSDEWNQPPAAAGAIIERGRDVERLRDRITKRFSLNVLECAHATDIAYVEKKTSGIFGSLAFFDARFRAIRKRWKSYRLPSYRGSLIEQATDMRSADRLSLQRGALASEDAKARELFGALWQGERSRWDTLDNYVQWVVEFRGTCVRHGLAGRAIEVAATVAPDVSNVVALRAAATTARQLLARLREAVGWPHEYLDATSLKELSERVRSLADGVRLGPQWAAFESTRRIVADSLAGELLPEAMNGNVAFGNLAAAFLRAFYSKWLTDVVRQRPALEQFHTLTHEERLAEFRRLDERVLVENRTALVARLRDRTQEELRRPEVALGMQFLRNQLTRQRGHAPLRRTMQKAGTAVRAIKPCFMMSPLTVAQLVDGSAPSFDLVIFDEASQLAPEDAVGAIIRGRQLVVVGDPKQLPPTNFFGVADGLTNVELGDDGLPVYEDAESILEQYMGAGVPMSRLRWHYRSAHESLITYSNVEFYDGDLYTFPSVERDTSTYGLQFEYVPNAIYEGKGLNLIEARRVADAVAEFAHVQLQRIQNGERPQSLGVGTFNMRQQLAIQDELEVRRRRDPSIDSFFDRGSEEPFFVKNLENIQGDERDVIFISVTYARAQDGKLRYNFGPLNGDNGWRRLNVLVTRARQRMRVFSSFRGDEINIASTPSRGARLLREFLLYAEKGTLESLTASLAADTDSPFEAAVLKELTNRGYQVVPQVGTAGYRVDLGVLDDAVPGRFVCGIECDGVAYHSSETARDRDRLRQQVLEARGWTIHRVWSTDWFKDRSGQVERLVGLIEASRGHARKVAESKQQGQPRATTDSFPTDEVPIASTLETRPNTHADALYRRPTATPYTMTPGQGEFASRDILTVPVSLLVEAVITVVRTESPVHESDVFTRVAGMFERRAGSRIQARIKWAAQTAERDSIVRRKGAFYWADGQACVARSRKDTGIPATRIAPEEYEEAIRVVLTCGHAFARSELTNEVRAVFGFDRTGALLDQSISATIDRMLANGILGEASAGIQLRD